MNTSITTLETIQQAAIRVNNDVTTIPRPGRHVDIVKFLAIKGFDILVMEPGFVTSTGRYVTRIDEHYNFYNNNLYFYYNTNTQTTHVSRHSRELFLKA
jgi:signal peptidase I